MTERTRQAGAMTRAMSAQRAADALPRVLRVGILQGASSLEERIVRERIDVSAGTTERATLPVSHEGFPQHIELFVLRDGRYHLRFEEKWDGRVALGPAVHSLESLRAQGIAKPQGNAWTVALDDQCRGKVTVEGVTFLFQFAPAPPVAPKAQLPQILRVSLTREMDWRYNTALSCFLSIALGAMAWVEYGYDPIVDDNSDLLEFVSRRVRMAPPDDVPVEPAEAAAAQPTPSDANSNSSNTASRPNSNTPRTSRPSGAPSPGETSRAAQRAEAAAASAIRAMDASFAAITNPFQGERSAAEQLQNGALMAGTEADLRNVNGISTTQPTGIARNNLSAHANGLPGSQALGHHDVIATHDAPNSGQLTGPVGPRRPPTISTDEPQTDTCEGDAGAVARVVRNNLGAIRSCYERASRNNPALAGRLTLRFTVGESGRATSTHVQGVDPDLDQCVERAVQRWVFPVPACGAADYEYPVAVSPAQ